MNEYPNDQDYKVIVEEKYGRNNAQQFLQKHSHVLVHSNATKDLANVTRRMYMGYTQTNLLKEDVLEQDSRKKATAFILESEADNEELIEDLESASRRGHVFNENKQIQVRDVKKTEDGFDINLEYEDRNAARRTLLNSQSKSVSVSITQTDKDDIRKGTQEYRQADEFNAASDFFESWRSKRLRERQSEVKRVNFNLEKLPPEDRVKLFTEFLQTHPGSWRFEKVLELGIKQSGESSDLIDEESETIEAEEEIEEELDENLRGITNAVLKGTGLRENQFVQDCLDSGFYFSSVRACLMTWTQQIRWNWS